MTLKSGYFLNKQGQWRKDVVLLDLEELTTFLIMQKLIFPYVVIIPLSWVITNSPWVMINCWNDKLVVFHLFKRLCTKDHIIQIFVRFFFSQIYRVEVYELLIKNILHYRKNKGYKDYTICWYASPFSVLA